MHEVFAPYHIETRLCEQLKQLTLVIVVLNVVLPSMSFFARVVDRVVEAINSQDQSTVRYENPCSSPAMHRCHP